jgi:membrane protein required for colicin V production
MSGIDVALVLLLILSALRGLARGLLREGFGFAGLVLGLLAAMVFADDGAQFLASWVELPEAASLGVAFIGIFVLIHALLTLFGLLLDRLVASPLTRLLNRAGGALFGCAKGAAVLAFVLLFLRLFPVVPGLDERIIASPVASPMAAAAASVVRFGWQGPARPEREA